MQQLIFATNNQHKIEEIRAILKGRYNIMTLKEAGIEIEIPEPHDTLEKNAKEKAITVYHLTGINCFGEDTGLETKVLNGEPGVKSARYAGEGRDFAANIEKLLNHLEGKKDRTARFRTVISLIYNGAEYQFEGICNGQIISTPRGQSGFGYDPVFIPENATITFAEMSMKEKNKYSHRAKAMEQLILFLMNTKN